MRGNRHVHRGITIGMGQHLHATAIRLREERVRLPLRETRQANTVARAARHWRVEGPREERRLPLR